jgi:Domain of unknown function (DUF1917)
MASKKTTSRTRSTTKRTKTTRATTAKRAPKAKASAKPTPVDPMPTVEITNVAAPEVVDPEVAEGVPAPVPAPEYTPMLTRVPTQARGRTDDKRPSRHTADHYLHATGSSQVPVRRPGNWLIFVSRSRVDALWEAVRRAVESGRLGQAAKVSTALPDPLSPDSKKHVICVYTADEDDPADVRRVREGLRQLGITWKIPYKSDATVRAAATKYYE